MQGRAALSTTLELVASALGLEFYIGPPRKPGSARARTGYEGRTLRERPASDEETAPGWATKLQRDLRAGLREDLTDALRDLRDTRPESIRPKRPADQSPGSSE